MASRPVVPQQHDRGEGKQIQKNMAAEGRSRRVLQDIGNLVPSKARNAGAIVLKPNTWVHPQLLVNLQAAAEKNKKSATEFVDGVFAANGAREVAATKNPIENKKPEPEVILISSDEESEEKGKDKSLTIKKTTREGSYRKNIKTLSSILSARSKAAACGLSNKPTDHVVDIDIADIDNELAAVEYIDDMHKFYKLTEDQSRLHDYMVAQYEITAKMRSILVDWLIEVHRKFELMPETLYLTINIVDRFLSVKPVPKRQLQLVGISSMLIACKYEEIWAPEVNDFVCISDNAYVREQVLLMEKAILGKLEWYLTLPTPYVFLVRYIKASVPSDNKMENMVYFLAELSLVNYNTVVKYCPSMIAASAVYAARCTLDKRPLWTETLKHHTGFSEDQLKECAQLMVSSHRSAPDSKLKAVYKKFSSPDRSAVALVSTAKNLF